MTTLTDNVIKRQPRWSDTELYYHCDYETYSKLRSLHKWYYQTLTDYALFLRWSNKDPDNRKGPQPKYCEFFVKNSYSWLKMPERLDNTFVVLYQKARMPSTEPVTPFDGGTIEKINKAYAKAASHFI